MAKWEYQYIELPHTRTREAKIAGEVARHVPQTEAILNALGADGWEVVSVFRIAPGSGTKDAPTFLLRREVR